MKFLLIANYPEQAQPRQPPKAMTDAMEVLLAEGFSKGWLKDTGGSNRPRTPFASGPKAAS